MFGFGGVLLITRPGSGSMQPGDLSFCTYRGHAHTLARGVSVEEVLGELIQRDNGLMRGKGGSMHLTFEEHGVMGSYAIIGAHLPIACGVAWRAQYQGAKDVAVCFFGDGITNIGAFHEALNFAAVWKLPVVFVCENNLYMEYTPISEQAILGAAMGAAMTGLKPIVEIMFSDFFAVCFGYIANEFPKSRYMSNGQLKCPPVRITTPHIPLPAADALEDAVLPTVERIAETVKRSLNG
jgi:hypothetical protein